jgi:signal peptidase I
MSRVERYKDVEEYGGKHLVESGAKPEKPVERKAAAKKPPTLLEDLLFLLAKIAVIALFLVIIFTFLFGIKLIKDDSMYPGLRDGDLVIYYRMQKNYVQGDLIAIKKDGKTEFRRVVATEGDTVDINHDNGLEINGYPQQEKLIEGETLPVVDATEFPLTVGPEQVFVLGDNRQYSVDSRTYGCVDKADTQGRIITVIRRRNL